MTEEIDIFKAIKEAERSSLTITVFGCVDKQEGKEVLPVRPDDLWDISADKPVSCLVTYAPGKNSETRNITVGICSDRPLEPERLRFFDSVDTEALRSTAYLKGTAGGLRCYDRQLSFDEMTGMYDDLFSV